MMTQIKRGRGRPKGGGIDDAQALRKMAVLIYAGSKVRHAIKNVVPNWTETKIRRLYRKWNLEGLTLLQEIEKLSENIAVQKLQKMTKQASKLMRYDRSLTHQKFVINNLNFEMDIAKQTKEALNVFKNEEIKHCLAAIVSPRIKESQLIPLCKVRAENERVMKKITRELNEVLWGRVFPE